MAKKKQSKIKAAYAAIPDSVKLAILSGASMAAGAYGGAPAAQGASYLLKLLGGYLGS